MPEKKGIAYYIVYAGMWILQKLGFKMMGDS